MAHKLPVLVRTAGLAQALSFVEARGENPQRQLLDDLAATLGYQDGRAGLLAESRNAELSQYMYVTKQVLHALLWYKRFAQSVLDVQTAEADDNTPENPQQQEEEALTNAGAA
jgi:CRISPR-associated protein Cmr5